MPRTNPPQGWLPEHEAVIQLDMLNLEAAKVKRKVTILEKKIGGLVPPAGAMGNDRVIGDNSLAELLGPCKTELNSLKEKVDLCMENFLNALTDPVVVAPNGDFKNYFQGKYDSLHDYMDTLDDLDMELSVKVKSHEGAKNAIIHRNNQVVNTSQASTTQGKIDNNIKPKIILSRQTPLIKFEEWRNQIRDFYASDGMRLATMATRKVYFKQFIDMDLFMYLEAKPHFSELDVANIHLTHQTSLLQLVVDEFGLLHPIQNRRDDFFKLKQKSNESAENFTFRVQGFAKVAGLDECADCFDKNLRTVYLNGMTDPRARDKCLELGPKASRQDIEECLRDYTYFTSAKEQTMCEVTDNPGHHGEGGGTASVGEENGVNLLYKGPGQGRGYNGKGRGQNYVKPGRFPTSDSRGRFPTSDSRGRFPTSDSRGRFPTSDSRGRFPTFDSRGGSPRMPINRFATPDSWFPRKPTGSYNCYGCEAERKPNVGRWWECKIHHPEMFRDKNTHNRPAPTNNK